MLDTRIYDEILPISNEDAFAAGKLVGRKEGVLVGISSGAALHAAVELAKRPENAGKTIVVLFPDTGAVRGLTVHKTRGALAPRFLFPIKYAILISNFFQEACQYDPDQGAGVGPAV